MNKEKEPINSRRTARILTVACGLLFFSFSIVYLAVFQNDVLEALHYSLAEGKTQYSPWGSAIVITLVLMILRWVINGLVGFRGPLRGLSYFPLCLLLGVLTDVGHGVYHGEGIAPKWAWLLPLLLIGYVLLGMGIRRLLHWWGQRMEDITLVNINLLTLLVLCFMTVCIGNTNIHFHHELQMELALRNCDYAEARCIAEKTMDPSRNLTALRAYAMSREGTMGEHLFRYPQLYGAEGLLMESDNEKTLRLNADSLYVYLGDRPKAGETAMRFFNRICHDESGNYTTLDYYLSALLLEKKIDRFVTEFNALYVIQNEVPTYYKEALFLYGKMNPSKARLVEDEVMEERWQQYEALQNELIGTVGEGNRMRREFGDTYWWYFHYK